MIFHISFILLLIFRSIQGDLRDYGGIYLWRDFCKNDKMLINIRLTSTNTSSPNHKKSDKCTLETFAFKEKHTMTDFLFYTIYFQIVNQMDRKVTTPGEKKESFKPFDMEFEFDVNRNLTVDQRFPVNKYLLKCEDSRGNDRAFISFSATGCEGNIVIPMTNKKLVIAAPLAPCETIMTLETQPNDTLFLHLCLFARGDAVQNNSSSVPTEFLPLKDITFFYPNNYLQDRSAQPKFPMNSLSRILGSALIISIPVIIICIISWIVFCVKLSLKDHHIIMRK
ncbi:hypothetical protein SNEBB_000377 [Seison nebaliae]|nr:hypothetical protein SNEBB_000377 [Seison nebaliae]